MAVFPTFTGICSTSHLSITVWQAWEQETAPSPEKAENNLILPCIILFLQCAKAALWDSGQFRSIDPTHAVRVSLRATVTDVV